MSEDGGDGDDVRAEASHRQRRHSRFSLLRDFSPSPSVAMMFMTRLCRAVSKVRRLYAVICKTRVKV